MKVPSVSNTPTPASTPLLVVLDSQGRICQFNDAAEKISGLHFSDVAGRLPWETFLPPDEVDNVRHEAFEALMRDSHTSVSHYLNHWLDRRQTRHLIDWTSAVLRNDDGSIEYLVAIGVDVTVREQAEAAKRKAEHAVVATNRLLESMVENIPLMIFMKRADDLRFTLFNRAGEQLLGYDRGELLGKNDYDCFPADQADAFTRKDRQVLDVTGFEDIAEEPINTRAHGRRILHTKKVALKAADGTPEFLLGISEDITERKRAETALAESEARYREAQRLARIGSWELDLIKNRLVWSDEIFRMFEVDKARFSASYDAFLNAIHPDDRDAVNAAYTHSLGTRTPYSITHRLRMRDGTIKWVQEQCASFFDAVGTPLRSVGTVQDITERVVAEETLRRSEEQLRELNESLERRIAERTRELQQAKDAAESANRAKSEFLSRMSHELRTPLNAMLGFAQLLQLDPNGSESADQIAEIRYAGMHLLDLINDLLDLARIESGKLAAVITPVAIELAVADGLRIVKSTLEAKCITVHTRIPPGSAVMADATRLRQVLVNLMSNAIKYNRTEGRIDIECHPAAAGCLRVSVIDTGPGVAPTLLPRLFRPFDRLGAEFTATEGTGIGLTLVKQLIELMNGRVGALSTPGQGSTFWFELPRAAQRENSIAAAASALPAARPGTVLYIEDNAANVRVMRAMFEQMPQLRLLTASDGDSGLASARQHRPDIILLDIHLPGRDGYSVLADLRADAQTHAIPVVALTADAMPTEVERGARAGFARYLTKPVDLRLLIATIDELRAPVKQ